MTAEPEHVPESAADRAGPDQTGLDRLGHHELSRRRVLHGAAGLGVLGVTGAALAACGGEPTSSGGSTPQQSAASPEQSSAPASEAPAESGIASTADIPVGGGVIIEDPEPIVITQPTEGEFKAFTAICTHQGCTVASVQDNTIGCPCHGSMYDAATGEVIGGPAPQPLAEKTIAVEGDQILLG